MPKVPKIAKRISDLSSKELSIMRNKVAKAKALGMNTTNIMIGSRSPMAVNKKLDAYISKKNKR